MPDLFSEFLCKYIRPKRTLFIGACPKDDMEKLFGPIALYVNTPLKNSYATIEEWYPKVVAAVKNGKPEMVIVASGQATRALQARLWILAEKNNLNFHSIDIGSVVDAVSGYSTRTWNKKAGDKIRRRYDTKGE